jgi:hypothetical protein
MWIQLASILYLALASFLIHSIDFDNCIHMRPVTIRSIYSWFPVLLRGEVVENLHSAEEEGVTEAQVKKGCKTIVSSYVVTQFYVVILCLSKYAPSYTIIVLML